MPTWEHGQNTEELSNQLFNAEVKINKMMWILEKERKVTKDDVSSFQIKGKVRIIK